MGGIIYAPLPAQRGRFRCALDLHTRRNTSVSLEVNYCDIAVALLREIIKKG